MPIRRIVRRKMLPKKGMSDEHSGLCPLYHRRHYLVRHLLGRQRTRTTDFYAAGRSIRSWQNGIAIAGIT